MRRRMSARPVASAVAAALASQCAMAALLGGAANADDGWAPKVSAVYKLRMAGFDVATFNFVSSVTGDTYALSGHSKMAWGFGLFKYTGSFASSGRLAGETVQPASYTYDWHVNAKSGSVRIAYAGNAVRWVDVKPPTTPGEEVVPLSPEHLKAVVDPLTALIVLSRHRGGDPCNRKIGLFEGKQRFDLVLTPLRQEKVVEHKPSGQPVLAHVCRVRYIPVAGHKLNRETQAAVKADGIEVALRPLPAANLAVPYRVVLPTPLGTAILTAHRVDITAPGNKPIALTH